MKMTIKPLYFVFFLMITFVSCNNEELFVEPASDVVTDDTTTPEDNTVSIPPVSTPCDFNLSTVTENSTVVINCVMDLGGQTINLPAGVTLVYEGGDIINGTLNFSSNTVISGELLNSSLELGGTSPQIKDTFFNFKPERWGIVEGEVSQGVANNNRLIIRDILSKVHDLGVSTFKIDKLDAYFYGSTWGDYVFELPSNFNLVMTDNTHLRAFLNSSYTTFLMIINKENVQVSGGHLYGYRHLPGNNDTDFLFDYLIKIKSGQNVVIENVHMSYGTEDGMSIESDQHAYEANYKPSKNVLVKGCTFNNNGRNNLSIVDGQDIIIEDCTFLKAGNDTPYSKGQAPRFAIDIEPVGHGNPQPLQRVERVIIRNCTERGSAAGGIIASDGDDILITGNNFETTIGYSAASTVRITNNTVGGIGAGDNDAYALGRNNHGVVSGNIIKNVSVGIYLKNKDIDVYDNEIVNCSSVGILIDALSDSHIYNNTITNSDNEGDGINAINYINNVLIENNTIDILDKAFYFTGVNSELNENNYTFTFKNNVIKSNTMGIFQWSYGGKLISNSITNAGVNLDAVKNFTLDGNTVLNGNVQIGNNVSNNIVIKNNTIDSPTDAISGEASSSENKNIVISNNVLRSTTSNRHWGGININGYNGITVSNNTGKSGQYGYWIVYRGNNATFTGNKTETNGISNDIVGLNNTVNN